MNTQARAVLSHLKQTGFITCDIATDQMGIRRLGARIFELRKDGHDIATHILAVPNRYGTTSKIALYVMQTA